MASDLPLSLRIDSGARWVAGDVVDVQVLVRNRTDAPLHATVDAIAEGAAVLEEKPGTVRALDIPAKGARNVRVRVRAKDLGEGRLVLTAHAPNLPDDVLRHSWEIIPAGERRALTQTAWVEGDRALGLSLDHGYALMGEPRLVLERGFDDAVAAALESLEPELQISAHGLVDSMEAGLRIQRWATTKDSPRHRALANIAANSAARALGRYNVMSEIDKASAGVQRSSSWGPWALTERVAQLTKQPRSRAEKDRKNGPQDKDDSSELCPPEWSGVRASFAVSTFHADEDDVLDVEPADSAASLPCWGAYVSEATRALATESDAQLIARALLALAERPHRAAMTASLATTLRKLVKLDAAGEIDIASSSRAREAFIYAALLRTQPLGVSPATADVLFGRIAKLRDVTGGYGSSSATVAVLRALLSSQLEGHGTTRVRVQVNKPGQGALDRAIDVPPSGSVIVPLPAGTLDVLLHAEGSGLVARFERPVLRSWTRPPPPQGSPVAIEVVWPADAKAGSTGILRVLLSHTLAGRAEIDAKIPLPPGVTLGAPTKGAAQVQGVLAVRETVGERAVLEIPVRFGLAGKLTVPEATAHITRSSSPNATAPARALTVR